MIEDDSDAPISTFDHQARAENIKRHVQKVVNQKKAEAVGTTILLEDGGMTIDPNEVERYTNFGMLKKTVLLAMANTMDRSEVQKLRELFVKIDTNDSGSITLTELLDAFKEATPDVDEDRVKELFKGVDRDKSGHIHYAEFLAALAESHGLVTLNRLQEAFDRIDTDGKGYIDHDDLKNILGADYDKDTVDQMIKEGDFKKNNQIDYEELLQLMFSDPVGAGVAFESLSKPLTFESRNPQLPGQRRRTSGFSPSFIPKRSKKISQNVDSCAEWRGDGDTIAAFVIQMRVDSLSQRRFSSDLIIMQ